jgi:HAE1 family hydrophobic/amphiphilic exporter-1
VIVWAVRRPAVVWASAAALLLAGGVAFTKLPLATRPTVELPRLTIIAVWPGASAELVEAYLSAPIEAAVQSVRGVRRVDSESDEGNAQLTVRLAESADVPLTRLAVLERLDLLRDELPAGATPPRVSNYIPEELAEQPLLRYTISGPYTPGTLAALARRTILPRVSTLPGVAGVSVAGGAETGVTVAYDAARLRQLGIAPEALANALLGSRLVRAVGERREGSDEVPVALRDAPASLEALAALPVTGPAGRVLRLGDLADIRADEDTRDQFYRINGEPAVALTVARQPGADAIRTAAAVRREMARLGGALPPAVAVRLQSDESAALRSQLADLARRGAVAFTVVLLVLFLGLRRPAAAGLVMLSALIAIAGTALGLYLLGIPANLLTLAGLGMGIGILVQNGVVVVSRLQRVPPEPAARAAEARRITPAVLGATLTTVVVLMPFLFLQGNARAAFVPFAVAFALALGWSVLSSVVMIPAIAGGSLARGGPAAAGALGAGRRRGPLARLRRRLERLYAWFAIRLVRWRWIVVVLTLAGVGVAGWGFFTKVPRWSFGSWYGQRSTLSAYLNFPRGSDPQSLDRAMREFEAIVVGRPGVDQVTAQGGRDGANLVVSFTRDPGMTPYLLQDELTQRAILVGGASVGVHYQGPGFYSGGGSSAITQRVKLLGYSYEGLLRIAQDLKARLERIPRVRDVTINSGSFWWSAEKAYEVVLRPDRAALARSGLTATDLARAVNREAAGAGGSQRLVLGEEEVVVSLKDRGARERTIDQLRSALIPNPAGAPVRIGDVARVEEREVLNRVSRQDQQYVRILAYEFRGPPRLAERTHKAFMASITLPPGYSASDAYFDWEADQSDKGLWLVFAIGIVLVVLSVAMVFDSLWATAMVFLGLPVALAGSAVAFWIAGAAFNREAAVGVVLVVGLAVNQIILVVDAALRRRRVPGEARGWRRLTGADVVAACRDRVGMVTLVTLTTLASLLPLAIGTDPDELFGSIALATVGGTLGGTLAALVTVPALLLGYRRWMRKRRMTGASSSSVAVA